ncbi:MAG: hypothetical protein AAF629_19755 [Chloroflexota bacterium]
MGRTNHPDHRGPISVRLKQVPRRSIHLETEPPANTVTTVMIPYLGSDDPTVIVDGKLVMGRLDDGFVSVTDVDSGRHTFGRAV